MSDAGLLSLVSKWRARAEEILAQAETMQDVDAREKMREVCGLRETSQRRQVGAGSRKAKPQRSLSREAQGMMRVVAAGYKKLARRVEQRANEA
jgi:hypothetical protein